MKISYLFIITIFSGGSFATDDSEVSIRIHTFLVLRSVNKFAI